jgi:hypothetical protein
LSFSIDEDEGAVVEAFGAVDGLKEAAQRLVGFSHGRVLQLVEEVPNV